MMELILIIIFTLIFFVAFYLSRRSPEPKKEVRFKEVECTWNPYIRELDPRIAQAKQMMEDSKMFREYAFDRWRRDHNQIWKDAFKTRDAIQRFPDLMECVDHWTLNAFSEKYDKYAHRCEKLRLSELKLSREEFVVLNKYPALCWDWTTMTSYRTFPRIYYIHDYDSAKYKDGKLLELLEQEYEQKYGYR